MATIRRYLSTRVTNGVAEIYLRLSVSMNVKHRLRSGYHVKPQRFKDGAFVFPRANPKEGAELHALESSLAGLEGELLDFCLNHPAEAVAKDALAEIIERHHHPERFADDGEPQSFFSLWDDFLRNRGLSKNREDIYRSLARALHRYECWRRDTRDPEFRLNVDELTADDILDFEMFFRNEWRYYDEYPQIYVDYPAEVRLHRSTLRPQRRGDNIVVNTLKRIRAFYNWCFTQGITANRPFARYQGTKAERYGTPYYLTLDEVEQLAAADLSARPALAVQRDIFIFQCQIGCRVSDLMRLERSNIVGDMLEYVAKKTIKDRTDVIRVPLNARAHEILARYSEWDGHGLLPFISSQRYNDAIKEMCRLAGIDRVVTVINPTTGKDERRPIHEIASSHLARRTFIGNLYKRVKDPNLVSSLSGHKEGSRAFARYREIDDDMKRDLVSLLDG